MTTFNVDEDNMKLFWYWIFERQNIYHRRFVLGRNAPWTHDDILRQFKFTNVYRELDRTTIWYQNHIGSMKDNRDKVLATFTHRLFNKIETMEKLLPYISVRKFSLDKITNVLEHLRNNGQNPFTSAHIVTGVRFGGYDDKLYNILHLVDLIYKNIKEITTTILNADSPESLYTSIRNVHGFGPFLGFQTWLDFINSGIKKFSLDSFVVAGPGCKRGICHIFPNAPADISFEDAMRFLRKNQHKFFSKYGFNFKFVEELGGSKTGIHLANIENCCCEFSKYWKAHNGVGRPRNHFVPTSKQLEMFNYDDIKKF